MIEIVLHKDNFKDFKLTGSKTQDERNELIALESRTYDRMDNLWEQIAAIKEDSTEMFHHIPIAEKYPQGEKFFTSDDII